ncbi:MAG: tetratricopeptide (TPR) repeat protein [Saprospiraceae bacterium]|jgi:tetratricopeptide (TPR) repeat protein
MKEHMHVIRPLLFMTVLVLFFGSILYDFVSHNPVFGPPRALNEDIASEWELYLKNREKRNLRAMNLSYDELIQIAASYEEIGERQIAIEHYYQAKTIFPERIEPRVRMCYLYLKECQEDWRYCRIAKKELYFAEKYMEKADQETQQYIAKLISLMKMDNLVQMDEKDALALIY